MKPNNNARFIPKDIVVNTLILHSEAFGDTANPACLLIACKRGTARLWSDNFCQYLADHGFFVIRYDHRDVGESCAIDWQKAPYTMAHLAKDATLILDGYGIKKANFIGDSMGGWICQQIGVNHPDRVLSLVIISAGPIEITERSSIPITKEEQEAMDTTSKMFITRKDGVTLQETIESYLPIWRHCNGAFPLDEEKAKAFTRDFLTRIKHNNAGANHELMMGQFLSTMKPLGVLKKINCPTLVIHGDKDTIVPPRFGQAVADEIPQSTLVMIPGMGHSFFNRDLETRIAKLVVEHVKKASKI